MAQRLGNLAFRIVQKSACAQDGARPTTIMPVKIAGIVIVGGAMALMYLTQLQMGKEWRIGIDTQNAVTPRGARDVCPSAPPRLSVRRGDRNWDPHCYTRADHIPCRPPAVGDGIHTGTAGRGVYDQNTRRHIHRIHAKAKAVVLASYAA